MTHAYKITEAQADVRENIPYTGTKVPNVLVQTSPPQTVTPPVPLTPKRS